MDLFRLHAYAVAPQKDAEEVSDPEGGAVSINAELRQSITANLQSARFDSRTVVDFDVDLTTRTNEVRDQIIEFAFGEPAAARAAGIGLARRLSTAMDKRSTVALWTFPRDEAFRLQPGAGGPTIQVLTDVFSQTSHLRKAARFKGRGLRNHFLNGRVLDFQANQASKSVADFWIGRFLQCRFGITNDAGTRLLARTVRKAFDDCEDPQDQEELYTGAMAIRRSPQKRISLREFARRYLRRDGGAFAAFIKAVPNEESVGVLFDFQTPVFDEALQFRVFQLDTGVFVSSPLTQVGKSVQITEGQEKELSCRGTIVEERLRTRHA
jgi:hypothetical protein